MIEINGARLLGDLKVLAEFGKVGTGVHRLGYTPEDRAARDWLRGRMAEAGLDATIDGIGNGYGQAPKTKRAVLIGSHTDTVPNGGWLDGALGVIYGLEIARALIESGAAGETGVDVISFAEEEGRYHGTAGSLSFCGEFSQDDIAHATGGDGSTLAEALAEAGYADSPMARLDQARHAAYFEAHIEQGPRLEAESRRIGVVTGIVGIRRTRVVFEGRADHAGTTPMALRRDAASALIAFAHDLIQRFERLRGPDTVWNFGAVAFDPGAANVVQKRAEMVVEYRDIDPGIIAKMEAALDDAVTAVEATGKVTATVAPTLALAPAAMTRELGEAVAAAAEAQGAPAMWMPSGAGHDAMVLARHVPTAMLFIPSIGGRSHDVAEDTDEADIVLGARVLAGAVERLIA